MQNVEGQDDTTMLWGDLTTAVAYFVITSQLLLFVLDRRVYFNKKSLTILDFLFIDFYFFGLFRL